MQLRGDVATPREREVIVRQAQHLVRLVDDLLDVSRVARGKVTLDQEADRARRSWSRRRSRRPRRCSSSGGTSLHLSVPRGGLPVDADEVRLTQVVSNLLTNAARYTAPGGRIEVPGRAGEGEEVVLRVRDNGTGIDPALLPHVFEMFVQGARGPDRVARGPRARACRWCGR